MPGVTAAVAGLAWLWRRSWRLGLLLTLLWAVNWWFAFRYNVGDVHVFFIPSHWIVALAAGCAAIGLLGSLAVWTIAPLAAQLAGLPLSEGPALLEPMTGSLRIVLGVAGALAGLVAALALLRALLLRNRNVGRELTWDCGYVKPDARMQYTSSSFAQPLT